MLESNPVLISGYRVGQVESIEFDHQNPEYLRVTVAITHGIVIPYGTKAIISSLDLMGSKGIELKVGHSELIFEEFDTIPGIEEVPLFDKIDPLQQKAENILKTVDTIVNSVELLLNRKMIMELRDAISNIKRLSGNLADQNENINYSLKNLREITDNILKYDNKLNNILSNANAISDTIKNIEFKATVRSMKMTIDEARKIFENINNGKGSLGKVATNDSIYNEFITTTKKINILIDDIQNHPKRYVHFSVFGNKTSEK